MGSEAPLAMKEPKVHRETLGPQGSNGGPGTSGSAGNAGPARTEGRPGPLWPDVFVVTPGGSPPFSSCFRPPSTQRFQEERTESDPALVLMRPATTAKMYR